MFILKNVERLSENIKIDFLFKKNCNLFSILSKIIRNFF